MGNCWQTVQRWVALLERLFVIFVVRPYSKQQARSLQKEPKIFFYDTGQLTGDEGARLENTVACALLKQTHFIADTQGKKAELYYLRDREKREVDFLTVINNEPQLMVEVKWSDDQVSPHLKYFSERFASVQAIQVVKTFRGIHHAQHATVQNAADWLATLV